MITTRNPYTNKELNHYKPHSASEIINLGSKAKNTFENWKDESIASRCVKLSRFSQLLLAKRDEYAELMTTEMGKPIAQSNSEIEKCAWVCDFYAKNAQQFLADDIIKTDASESFISYDPLGVILGVMPWNFPFWQVIRFAAPTLTAGNTILLKHASNVSGCATALEKLFKDAGYPDYCYNSIITGHDEIDKLIAEDSIAGVSVTGSETAGKHIAATAGEHLKPCVLELGGNNACIIWEDADLDEHMDTIINARMQNTGQSCIAAKRYIIVDDIYERFLDLLKEKLPVLVSADPKDTKTDVGVIAREDLADTLDEQIRTSVSNGAKVTMGNMRKDNYFEPTILENVKPGMPAFDQELFGPVFSIIRAKNREHSIDIAANSRFGLGTMLFTEDLKAAKGVIQKIPDGSFFINEMVKSHPQLPFGGTKASGYGRELSREGILAFTNKKTVYIN